MTIIELKRGYEVLPDNNVRFGIRVINSSDSAISDVEVILDYSESLFVLEGSKVHKLGTIPPAVPRTAKFILKPRGCIHKEEIGATIRYKDHLWKRHTLEMRPLEVHCVVPFLEEKAITRADFIALSNSGYLEERGVNFDGITVAKLVDFILHTYKNRLYRVDEVSIENGKILYLAGNALGEKAYYLLTAVVKEYEGVTQVLLRAASDKDHGLNGFLNEIMDNLQHLVSSTSAREIGIIKKEQVINIIDSVVQRTTFAAGEGAASVNIEGSVVQRTEIKGDAEKRRQEEERLRAEKEEQERVRREEAERKEVERKAREEAEKRKREEQKARQEEERLKREKEEQTRKRQEQERLRREEEEKKARERRAREEREKKAREEAEKRKKEEQKAKQEEERLKREKVEQTRKRLEEERQRKEKKEQERLRREEEEKKERAREESKAREARRGSSQKRFLALILVLSAILLGFWAFAPDSTDAPVTPTVSQTSLPTPSSSPTLISTPTPASTPTSTSTPAANLGEVITNTIGMEFVPIAAGAFEMGSPSDEEDRDGNEGPVHQVNIEKAFYMGRYEVTQKQWREIMDDNPSLYKGNNLPVETVLWDDVQKFIKKLNEKEGTGKYRLPSEAEWEYACRAGTTTRYSFGDSESQLGDYAWYYGSQTHPVGQKKANSWGLYDMHGNVWEWVQDMRHDNYNGAPTDGSVWESGDSGADRVARGGSYDRFAWDCRSATRDLDCDPRYRRGSGLGFRLLRTDAPVTQTVSQASLPTPTSSPTLTPTPTPASTPTSTSTSSPTLIPTPTPASTSTSTSTPAADLAETFTNTLGMEFVPIAAGEFEMGSPSDEEGRYSNEGPVHHVNIEKAFYMGRYEVTQKQWREIMGDNPSEFEGDDLPVEDVSWDDVHEFIKKLNEKEGTGKYRLPSEAEWEYACRAGTTTTYSFGDYESQLGDYAWYDDNSGGKTHPVGQKKPNSWGLYDMHGNVWEWVQDSWHSNYNGAPADGSAWENGDGADRVLRGGGWSSSAVYGRSADRNHGAHHLHMPYYYGFRILKEQ